MSPPHPTAVSSALSTRSHISTNECLRESQPAGIPMVRQSVVYHAGSSSASAPYPKSTHSAYIGAPLQGLPQASPGQANDFAWTATNLLTSPEGLQPTMPEALAKTCASLAVSHQDSEKPQESAQFRGTETPLPASYGNGHDVSAQQQTPSKLAEPEAHESLPEGVTPETQNAFRTSHGLEHPSALEFMHQSEFVSLGTYCAVTESLEVLGLRKRAYPFDFVRSPIEGVIHCLDSEFEDFLTFTDVKQEGQFKTFTGSRWGGSFWHHDPTTPESKEMFLRRALRLYGQGDVPDTTPRVFVRAINSTQELNSVLRLKDALQRALPRASCYLLLMVDMQATAGPIRLSCPESRNILFYEIHESLWQQHATGDEMMQACREAYAEALAFAIKYWSQCLDPATMIGTCHSLEQLSIALQPFSAGEPANKLFRPHKFLGQQLSFEGSLRWPQLLGDNLVAFVRVPERIAPGGRFEALVFGQVVPLRLPSDMCFAGELLKLTLVAGVVSATLATIGLTANAATAAAAVAVGTSAATAPPNADIAEASQLLPEGLPTRC